MRFLLDTNVISELTRREVDRGIATWAQSIRRVSLSVVTIEEINYGLAWRPNLRIQEIIGRFIEEHCVLIDVSPEIARAAGQLRGEMQSRGETRSQADMLICATAAVHGLTLVTRNVSDFQGCGVALLNPFRG